MQQRQLWKEVEARGDVVLAGPDQVKPERTNQAHLLQRFVETTGRIITYRVLRVQVDTKLHYFPHRTVFWHDGITSHDTLLRGLLSGVHFRKSLSASATSDSPPNSGHRTSGRSLPKSASRRHHARTLDNFPSEDLCYEGSVLTALIRNAGAAKAFVKGLGLVAHGDRKTAERADLLRIAGRARAVLPRPPSPLHLCQSRLRSKQERSNRADSSDCAARHDEPTHVPFRGFHRPGAPSPAHERSRNLGNLAG